MPTDAAGLRFDERAYGEWKDFQKTIETRMREGGRAQHIRDWASKLPGEAARIVGIFHAVKYSHEKPWERTIEVETMESALSLAVILLDHALAVFDLMARDPRIEEACRVLRWIAKGGKTEFSLRDCFCAYQSHFQRVDALQPVFAVLVEHGSGCPTSTKAHTALA